MSNNRETLAAVLRSVTTGTASSDRPRLLREAVAGGLLVAEGVTGCSVTEIDEDRCRTTVYVGEAAIALDLVQYATGRGPCLTAIRHERLHHTDDAAELNPSLPGWREQAARHGVGSVLSVPLPGASPAAGINFYGTTPGVFRPEVVTARALLVSRAVAALLTRDVAPAPGAIPEDAAREPLAAARRQRAVLTAARAAIARSSQFTDTEAFAYLAQRSTLEGRGILAVARDVLADPDLLADQEPPT